MSKNVKEIMMGGGLGEQTRRRDNVSSKSRCHVDLRTEGEADRGGQKRPGVRGVIQTTFSPYRASDS